MNYTCWQYFNIDPNVIDWRYCVKEAQVTPWSHLAHLPEKINTDEIQTVSSVGDSLLSRDSFVLSNERAALCALFINKWVEFVGNFHSGKLYNKWSLTRYQFTELLVLLEFSVYNKWKWWNVEFVSLTYSFNVRAWK